MRVQLTRKVQGGLHAGRDMRPDIEVAVSVPRPVGVYFARDSVVDAPDNTELLCGSGASEHGSRPSDLGDEGTHGVYTQAKKVSRRKRAREKNDLRPLKFSRGGNVFYFMPLLWVSAGSLTRIKGHIVSAF